MLRILSFSQPTSQQDIADMQQANIRPLMALSDTTYLVRVPDASMSAVPPAVRNGTSLRLFSGDDKLSPRLRAIRDNQLIETVNLYVHVSNDADVVLFSNLMKTRGMQERSRATSSFGTSFVLRGPASIINTISLNDSVLWLTEALEPQLQDSPAELVMNVQPAKARHGLTGEDQIIAITDSGLDASFALSADFAGRLVAGYGPQQVDSTCTSTDWSDYNGHGTHVAGTAVGSGALAAVGVGSAGMAPAARFVVQSVRSESNVTSGSLGCLPPNATFLQQAYMAGARIHNASFNLATDTPGQYTSFDHDIDAFLWDHKDAFVVVSAGNGGIDTNNDGVIDAQSVASPATAKNTFSVGASENLRPPSVNGNCLANTPFNCIWKSTRYTADPIANDYQSNNPAGMAPFSGRGPTIDGRIKPSLVAPGTNVLASRSHALVNGQPVSYRLPFNTDYAYLSGTSMSAPMVAGTAALLREWVMQPKPAGGFYSANPSAALLTALLLNGTTPLTIGQYGDGPSREIPATWPNTVAGWGRANVSRSIGAYSDLYGWDVRNGMALIGEERSFSLPLKANKPVRLTLAWTDMPHAPISVAGQRALINDLDVRLIDPAGHTVGLGNSEANLPTLCRDTVSGADRCNTAETIRFTPTTDDTYRIVVSSRYVEPQVQQPFALVADTAAYIMPPEQQPAVSFDQNDTSMHWDPVPTSAVYEIWDGADTFVDELLGVVSNTTFTLSEGVNGDVVVRGCNASGCGPFSEQRENPSNPETPETVTITLFAPLVVR